MKALLLLLILILAAACSEQKAPPTTAAPAAVADNEESRQAAAKEYLEAMPPQELLTNMTEKVVKMLPEKNQKVFLEVMTSKAMQDATYRITMEGLTKHFTVNELKAMAKFYGSPEGKAISKKFPAYMAEAMPKINQEVVAALQKAQKEHPELMPAPGPGKPMEPKASPAPAQPAEPQAPKAQPEKPAPPAPQAPPAPPSGK